MKNIEYAPSMADFFLKPFLAYKESLVTTSVVTATGHDLDCIANLVGYKNNRVRSRKKMEYFKRTAKERSFVSYKLRLKIKYWQQKSFLDDMQTREDILAHIATSL